MLSNSSVQAFCRDGFCKLPELLPPDTTAVLQQLADRLLAEPSGSRQEMLAFFESKQWKSCTWTDPSNSTIHYDFLGESLEMDAIIDSVLANPRVRDLLRAALGDGYRIWYVQIRRANPGAAARRMHVDEPGETTLSILLEDQDEKPGTTVFIPGSQFWPRVINSFPFIRPEHLNFKTVGATGKAGDAYLFSNGTWHGRAPNGQRHSTTILISFIPHHSKQQSRLPPPQLVRSLPANIRAMFEESSETQSMSGPATKDLADITFCQTRAGILHPWRLVMGVAWISDGLLQQWRNFKRRGHGSSG